MMETRIGQEIHGEAATAALRRTGLGIQAASVLEGEVGFFAAHGRTHSFFALVDCGETSVWRLDGGTKAARTRVADDVRSRIEEAAAQ
jgi:hypothetical protein